MSSSPILSGNMKRLTLLLLFLLLTQAIRAQGFQSIERIDAVTGKQMQVESLMRDKALILIFHSLKCPFAKMYEERIIQLRNSYSNKGINFVLVNPESGDSPDDQKVLREYVDASDINMSYLIDSDLQLVKQLGITKIPEIIILTPGANQAQIAYKGAIDNNPQAEASVSEKTLERAINQVLRGETPSPAQVRATGCNVKAF